MNDEQARKEIARLVWCGQVNNRPAETTAGKFLFNPTDFDLQVLIDKESYYEQADQILSKLHELNYYQLPSKLVEKLKDDCDECGGTGKDYGADPPVKIPIPCSNCKDGKVGEPHLERLRDINLLTTLLFKNLCIPETGDIQAFDWALSGKAIEWLYQMQSDSECARMVWSIIEKTIRRLQEDKGVANSKNDQQ